MTPALTNTAPGGDRVRLRPGFVALVLVIVVITLFMLVSGWRP